MFITYPRVGPFTSMLAVRGAATRGVSVVRGLGSSRRRGGGRPGVRRSCCIRIGTAHPDRLLTYPDVHNLSGCSLPIRVLARSSRWSRFGVVRSRFGAVWCPHRRPPRQRRPATRCRGRGDLRLGGNDAWPRVLLAREPLNMPVNRLFRVGCGWRRLGLLR